MLSFNSLRTAQMRTIDDAVIFTWRYVGFIRYDSSSPSVCPISPYSCPLLDDTSWTTHWSELSSVKSIKCVFGRAYSCRVPAAQKVRHISSKVIIEMFAKPSWRCSPGESFSWLSSRPDYSWQWAIKRRTKLTTREFLVNKNIFKTVGFLVLAVAAARSFVQNLMNLSNYFWRLKKWLSKL